MSCCAPPDCAFSPDGGYAAEGLASVDFRRTKLFSFTTVTASSMENVAKVPAAARSGFETLATPGVEMHIELLPSFRGLPLDLVLGIMFARELRMNEAQMLLVSLPAGARSRTRIREGYAKSFRDLIADGRPGGLYRCSARNPRTANARPLRNRPENRVLPATP